MAVHYAAYYPRDDFESVVDIYTNPKYTIEEAIEKVNRTLALRRQHIETMMDINEQIIRMEGQFWIEEQIREIEKAVAERKPRRARNILKKLEPYMTPDALEAIADENGL